MLRSAGAQDVVAIQSVLNAKDNLGKLAAYPDAAVLDAIEGAPCDVFVWEEAGQRHGFCWVRRGPQSVKIEEFGVVTPGSGIGAWMFEAVLSRYDGRRVWLAVAGDNEAARRFYERFGFRVTDVKPATWERRAGDKADVVTMERDGR